MYDPLAVIAVFVLIFALPPLAAFGRGHPNAGGITAASIGLAILCLGSTAVGATAQLLSMMAGLAWIALLAWTYGYRPPAAAAAPPRKAMKVRLTAATYDGPGRYQLDVRDPRAERSGRLKVEAISKNRAREQAEEKGFQVLGIVALEDERGNRVPTE